MTTTLLINGQSYGTGSNVGDLYRSIHELAATTTSAMLVVKSVQTSVDNNWSSRLNVRYAWSPNIYATAVEGINALKGGARYVELQLTGNALIVERCSLPVATAGGYLYVWVEAPTLPTAATVSVTIIELP